MVLRSFSRARVPAALPALLIAAALAPAAHAQQTVYAFCTAMNPTTYKVFISGVFSVAPSRIMIAKNAFMQYAQSQDSGVNSASCSENASQQTVTANAQKAPSEIQQGLQKMGKSGNIVQTGWTGGGDALAAPAAAPAAATPAATSSAATQSIGSSMTATGQQVKGSMQQSVTGAETAGTGVVTGTVTDLSTQAQQSIKDGVGKMFHKPKPAQPAATATATPAATTASTPAPAANLVASNTAPAAPGATQPAPVHGTTPVPVPAPATSASAAADAVKPTIQPEGDGKHFLMMTPGQPDARELILVAGTNNVYLEEATGDKYIVLQNGAITHIPKKNVSAN